METPYFGIRPLLRSLAQASPADSAATVAAKIDALIRKLALAPKDISSPLRFLLGEPEPDDQWRQLEPGMVMTVEPGIYIADRPSVPEGFRNIGVRIEDDVLVTESGFENLTERIPKDPDELEALLAD